MNVCGKEIRVEGRWIRTARLDGEKYEFLNDPEAALTGLRQSGVRIELFTFIQRVTEPLPMHSYPMEWDNLAVLPVSTFDTWWNTQVDFKTRNKLVDRLPEAVIVSFRSLRNAWYSRRLQCSAKTT